MNTRNISIKQILAEQGILPKQQRAGYGMYLSPLRAERTPSFKVDYNKNLWYDFGSGEGGSIIDLVMRMESCSAANAIAKLENGNSFSFHRVESVESAHSTPSTLQIHSVEPLHNRHLIDYLQSKRAIDIAVAREYCREVHYTISDKHRYAIGFQSDAGGWELRNEFFKGSTSPKSPTTFDNGSNSCLLFEGFVDMLSYLTLKNTVRPTVDIAVLNSGNNLHRAEEFLKRHSIIHSFLDNDTAGCEAHRRLTESICATTRIIEVVDNSTFYRQHKDLNDYLQSKNRTIQAEPRKGLRF